MGIGLALPMLLVPFLFLVGLGLFSTSAEWARPITGGTTANWIGLAAVVLYVVVVFGIPALIGAGVGIIVGRFLGPRTEGPRADQEPSTKA